MVVRIRTDIPVDFIRRVLDYDPSTGVLSWKLREDRPNRWNSRYAGKAAGTISPTGYVYIQILGRVAYPGHRLAWVHFHGRWPAHELDHVNGDRADNRIGNLREADDSEQSTNKAMQRNNTSGYVGVHFDKQRKKWRARVNKNRVMHDVGFFNTPDEAAAARREFVKKIQREFVPDGLERPIYQHARDAKKGKR